MFIYTDKESNKQNITNYIKMYFDINLSGLSVVCIKKIPRNDSGKILYSKLERF